MKVAIIGSAPSSASLAPYDDPEWQIWVCSPSAMQFARRVDMWFEIHAYENFSRHKDYMAYLAGLSCPVQCIERHDELPTSVEYPRDRMIETFGRAFFTSTPAWMMALAIDMQAEEIGIYGIDMATDAEYASQRPGCHYFIEMARQRGIKVTIPPQSDLAQPPALYGFDEVNPMFIKLMARKTELERRIEELKTAIDISSRDHNYLCGALEDVNYMLANWVQ